MIDRNFVKFLKEQYPKGTRIRLNSMADPYCVCTAQFVHSSKLRNGDGLLGNRRADLQSLRRK